MSEESDKLVIKTLRTAILLAWIMIVIQVAAFIINTTRDCPKSCVTAEKPAP